MATAAPGLRLYCSRRPERTLRYLALADHFERFLGVYQERLEPARGYLRRSVAPAVCRYLDCGIFAHGAARAHCAECGHVALIAFSCKLRCRCPSCHEKRELLWVEWASGLLAEVPHRQVVFTVPKRLRIFFRFDPRLLGELPGCAWLALRHYFAAWFGGERVVPGGTSSSFSLGCSITCRTRANSSYATGAGTATRRGAGASASKLRRVPRLEWSPISTTSRPAPSAHLVAAHPQGLRAAQGDLHLRDPGRQAAPPGDRTRARPAAARGLPPGGAGDPEPVSRVAPAAVVLGRALTAHRTRVGWLPLTG